MANRAGPAGRDARGPGVPARRWLALLPLLAVALAGAWLSARAAQEPPLAAGKPLRLRFDWPVGLRARVELAAQTRVTDGEKREQIRRRLAYRLAVEAAPEGRLIRFSDPQLNGLDPREHGLVRLLRVFQPSYLVDAQGELVRLVELDAMRRRFHGLIESTPQDREFFAERTAPEASRKETEGRWRLLLATWLPHPPVLGTSYGGDVLLPSPVGGFQMPLEAEWKATGPVPCHEADADPACVELLYEAVTDREATRRIIEDRADPDDPPWEIVVRKHIRLVTEPDGLLPHRLEVAHEGYFRVHGHPPVTEERRHLWRFAYPDR